MPRPDVPAGREEEGSAAQGGDAPAGAREEAPRPAHSREEASREEASRPARSRRRGLGWRTRDASAAAVGAAGAGVLLIARLVLSVATLIALLIALAIVLRDVDANASNTIVKGIHEGANFFAGAFTGLIAFKGHPKRAITIDWGIALVVYLLVGAAIAGVIRNVGRGGVRFEQRHRPAL
jgi:hypothetical protein